MAFWDRRDIRMTLVFIILFQSWRNLLLCHWIRRSICFFYGIIAISLISGLVGFVLLYKNWLSRLIGAFGVCLFGLIAFWYLRISEVYVVSPSLMIATLPWILLLIPRNKSSAVLVGFLFVIGVMIGYTNIVRYHSGSALLLFLIIFMLGKRHITIQSKVLMVAALMLGLMVPKLHLHFLLSNRDAYLRQNVQGYESVTAKHRFWHTVYIGFGFLDNPHGIKYRDEIAIQKVQEILPGARYLSKEYEDVLKNEVIQLLKEHPHFISRTVAAKMGVILYYLVIFSNAGLFCSILYPKGWSVEIAFGCALGFSALQGILAMPYTYYVSGFLAIAVVYAVVSVNHAIESGMLRFLRALNHKPGK